MKNRKHSSICVYIYIIYKSTSSWKQKPSNDTIPRLEVNFTGSTPTIQTAFTQTTITVIWSKRFDLRKTHGIVRWSLKVERQDGTDWTKKNILRKKKHRNTNGGENGKKRSLLRKKNEYVCKCKYVCVYIYIIVYIHTYVCISKHFPPCPYAWQGLGSSLRFCRS